MGKLLFKLLKLFGWNIQPQGPEGVKKAVIVMGPHTSNWDFIIGRISFLQYGINMRALIKSELFFFPLGWLLRKLGGIPVNRKSKNNLTEQAVSYFEDNDEMFMIFTPEGTRKYNPNWKKGFYYIAQKANVPIYIGFIDYSNKTGGFDSIFHPTGDVDADIIEIKRRLSKYKGKVPENGIFEVKDERKIN